MVTTMTYETTDKDGVTWRLHIDENDAEHAFLYRLAPGDQTKWQFALQLKWVRDDG